MEDIWMSAGDAAEYFAGHPLCLLSLDEIETELAQICLACGTDLFPAPPPGDDEWKRIIDRLLPRSNRYYGTKKWLASHAERERGALGYQASRLCRLVRHERDQRRDLPPARMVLVPQDWQARMRLCIGSGTIPFVWMSVMEEA